jgi:TonB-linked SusC/RagA family outer membrane protein
MKKNITQGTKTKLRTLRTCILCGLLFIWDICIGQTAFAQITGTVISAADNIPLPGANVVIKGTTTGVVTNLDGQYSIEASSEDILVFSFVGYIPQEITVGERVEINVTLQEDILQLEEIVVTGYGTVKKVDLTGSVSVINPEDIEGMPITRSDLLLQGRSAGVEVTQASGAPGGAVRIRIRGVHSINSGNDPLIVIDGFAGGELSSINPNDIERIDILKDASALAIYGARATNGVILVTTKSGKAGKSRVDFSYSHSFQTISKNIEVLDNWEWTRYANEAMKNDGSSRTLFPSRRYPFSPDASSPSYDSINWTTNWADEVYRQGTVDEYQVSFSGGTENINYYLSGNSYNHKGIVTGSEFKRISTRLNLNAKVTDHISAGINTQATRRQYYGEVGFWSGAGVSNSVLTASPFLKPYDEDGNFTIDYFAGVPADNPLAQAIGPLNDLRRDNYLANIFSEVEFITGLKLKVSIGVDRIDRRHGNVFDSRTITGQNRDGYARLSNYSVTTVLQENILSYTRSVDFMDISLLAGYSWQEYESESLYMTTDHYLSDGFMFDYNQMGNGTPQDHNTGKSEWTYESFLGRANINILNRYLITLNGRIDGSSRFARNNKYGRFPSGAIAWKLHEESFMQAITPVFSEIKLRASYGLVGNTAIAPYQSLASFVVTKGVVDNTEVPAVIPLTVANDNLTWETTAELDIGVDLGILQNRFTLNIDYYKKRTYDLLFKEPFPRISGYASILTNIGEVENKGLEILVHTVNISHPNFSWSTDFNFSRNRNKIIDLVGDDPEIPVINATMDGPLKGYLNYLVEGEPISTFVGFIYDGVYTTEEEAMADGYRIGNAKYRDLSGDGLFKEADDYTVIGSAFPDYIWGMNNVFRYKSWDMGIFLRASVGADIYNVTREYIESNNGVTNISTEMLNRTRYDEETEAWIFTDIPKFSAFNQNLRTDRFLEDGSFVRLENVYLAYNLPTRWLNRIWIQNMQVYVSGQNLAIWTDYKGYDPETSKYKAGDSEGGGNDAIFGIDEGTYPRTRSVTLGVKLTL